MTPAGWRQRQDHPDRTICRSLIARRAELSQPASRSPRPAPGPGGHGLAGSIQLTQVEPAVPAGFSTAKFKARQGRRAPPSGATASQGRTWSDCMD